MLLIPFILLYVGVSIDIDESADNDMLGACNDIYCVASMFIVPFPSIHIFEQHEPASLPFIVISSLPLSHILMLEYPEGISATKLNDWMWYDFESVCAIIGVDYDSETDTVKR